MCHFKAPWETVQIKGRATFALLIGSGCFVCVFCTANGAGGTPTRICSAKVLLRASSLWWQGVTLEQGSLSSNRHSAMKCTG